MKSNSPSKLDQNNKSKMKEIKNKRKQSNFDKSINILLNGENKFVKKRAYSELFINVNSINNTNKLIQSTKNNISKKKNNKESKNTNNIVLYDSLFNKNNQNVMDNENFNIKSMNIKDKEFESNKDKERDNNSSYIKFKTNSFNNKDKEKDLFLKNESKINLSPINLSLDSSLSESNKLKEIFNSMSISNKNNNLYIMNNNINYNINNEKKEKKRSFFVVFKTNNNFCNGETSILLFL